MAWHRNGHNAADERANRFEGDVVKIRPLHGMALSSAVGVYVPAGGSF